jgi:hypothetical protein
MKTINLILILGIITILLFSFGCTNTNVFDEYNYGIDNNQGFEDINNNSNELMTCSALGGIICNQGEECSTYLLSSSDGNSCCIQGECIGKQTTCGNGICEEGEGIFNCLSDCETDANQVPINNVSPPSQPPTEIPNFEPTGSPVDGMFIYSAEKFSENNKIFVWSDIFKGVNGNRTIPLHSLYSTAGDWIYNYSNKAWLYSENFSDLFKIEGTYYAKANQWYFYGNGWAEVTNLEAYTLQNCGNSDCETDLGENKEVCPKDCGSDTLNCSQISGTTCTQNQTCTTHTVTTKDTQTCCVEGNCEDEQTPPELLPEINVISEDQIQTVLLNDGSPLSPIVISGSRLTAYTEKAPTVINDKIFIPTNVTYVSDYNPANTNFINYPDKFKTKFLQTKKLIHGGDLQVDNSVSPRKERNTANGNILTQQEFQDAPFWRAIYGGVWSFEDLDGNLLGFLHGEEANQKRDNICYQSKVKSYISCSSCNVDFSAGNDCPESYNSFVAVGQASDLSGTNFIDEGPAVWPANGYTQYNVGVDYERGDTGWGVRHPNSIIKDGYIYVFYQDWSYGDPENGRGSGIKVARAPVDNAHAGQFESWYRLADGNEGWEPSLPIEFWSGDFYVKGKDVWNENYKNTPKDWVNINGCTMWNYGTGWLDREDKRGFQCFNDINDYSLQGGKSTSLFGSFYPDTEGNHYNDWPIIYNGKAHYQRGSSFSVAKIKGTDYYLGVEDSAAGFSELPGWFYYWIGLRISKDLIHWSEPLILEDTLVRNWSDLRLGHPNFLSKDFSSTKEIDADGFYIIGSHTAGDGTWRVQQLNYKYLEISLGQIIPQTCTSFTYSSWGECQDNNTKTRTVTSSSPSGCAGGNPVLTQTCVYVPSCVTGTWTNTSNYRCTSGARERQQTRTVTPTNCDTNSQWISYPCTSGKICTGNGLCTAPICTSFTYSSWSPTVCPQSETQTRTITSSSPSGCTGGNPVLTKTCIYIPPEICDGIDNDGDGQIDEGCDDDLDGYADASMECPSDKKFIVYKYSDNYKKTCPTNDWCQMGNETWWSWGNGWIGLNDEVWFNYENGWISRNIPCSTNSGDVDDTNPSVH